MIENVEKENENKFTDYIQQLSARNYKSEEVKKIKYYYNNFILLLFQILFMHN